MRDCRLIYIGDLEAEDRARRESELGFPAGAVDPAIDPTDYIWKLHDTDILAYDLTSSSLEYIHSLARALMEGGAHSVLIFDRDGRELFRHSPYGRISDEAGS